MSDIKNLNADDLFEQSDSLSWMADMSTPLSSNTTPTSDVLSNDWQAFMTYDDQSSLDTLPLSFLLPSESTTDSSANLLSQTDLSPSSTAAQLHLTPAAPIDLDFSQYSASQDFTFTVPSIEPHVSPFSESSHRLSDDFDGRTPSEAVGSLDLKRHPTSVSPKSDSSLNVSITSKPAKVVGRKKTSADISRNSPSNASRKRKQSEDDDAEAINSQDEGRPGVKKSAHNMIEKRYRNNLNDKIAALRDAVPALRNVRRNGSDGDENDAEDLEGLAPAHKLNKATVLSKATEYIRHLEKHKTRQEREINDLKSRLTNIERTIKSGRQVFHSPLSTPNVAFFQDDAIASTSGLASSTQAPANGMIPIPDDIAHFRQAQINQAPYGIPQASQPINSPNPAISASAGDTRTIGISRNGLFGRVMLTGITTIMLMEGLREDEQQGSEREARGLFSLPIPALNGWSRSNSFDRITQMPLHDIMRLGLLFVAIVYILAPVFATSRPTQKTKSQQLLRTTYSLASPVELRQKAWLTAIQTVWMPSHLLASEFMALVLRFLQVGTIKITGISAYSIITGRTKEHETARTKAWRTALDAQLSGGDANVSFNRLLLTLLASCTIPSTPSRIMLKALHVRVLLWNARLFPSGVWQLLDSFSMRLARTFWTAARIRYHLRSTQGADGDSELPEHLLKLLQLDVDDVLVDAIVQRCYNLTYNLHSTNAHNDDDAMDSVTEDIHIASPLDALAAWWSTLTVNRTLSTVIEAPNSISEDLKDYAELAFEVAPPPSVARIRAAVAKAVVTKDDREGSIQDALALLPYPVRQSVNSESSPTPSCVNLVGETPVPADVPATLAIAKCLALLEKSSANGRVLAQAFITHCFHAHQTYTLLSFAAALQLMQKNLGVAVQQDARSSSGLEQLSFSLRIFIGGASGARLRLPNDVRAKAVMRCISANKRLTGISDDDEDSDQGYVSQEDDARGNMLVSSL